MKNLIEIVFENILFDALGDLIKNLSSSGKSIKNYSLSADWELEGDINWHSAISINQAFKKHTTGWSFSINLNALNINTLIIKNCTLQVLHYDSQYDINIHFDLEDIYLQNHTDFVTTLMILSKNIALKYGIKDYFAGLEPACDEDTRLFTNDNKGPLTIPNPIKIIKETKFQGHYPEENKLLWQVEKKSVPKLQA